MNIDDMTVGELKQLTALLGKSQPRTCSLEIGKKYLFRTPAFHYVGRIKIVTDCDVILTEAAWVADSGRFNETLHEGKVSEFESYANELILNRDHIADATEWNFKLKGRTK